MMLGAFLKGGNYIFEDWNCESHIIEITIGREFQTDSLPRKEQESYPDSTIIFLDIKIEKGLEKEKINKSLREVLDSYMHLENVRLARPIPLCFLNQSNQKKVKRFQMPRTCEECLFLFSEDDTGYLRFCDHMQEVMQPKKNYFNTRRAIVEYIRTFKGNFNMSACEECTHWKQNTCMPCNYYADCVSHPIYDVKTNLDDVQLNKAHEQINEDISTLQKKRDLKKKGLKERLGFTKRLKNVTLFFPPIPNGPETPLWPCLGVAYLDAAIRDRFNSTVVDSGLFYDIFDFYKWENVKRMGIRRWRMKEKQILMNLIRLTESTDPDFLGISSWSYNMPFVAEFSRVFKARNPNIPLILGGINPTLVPDETLDQLPYIDFLVRGEGERTLIELLESLSKGKSMSHVKGISYRKDDRIKHTPDRPMEKNLDNLNYMDYENFVGFKRWHKKIKFPFIEIMTSRGCIAKCSFCSVYKTWGGQRFYSPRYVRNQIDHLSDLYDYSKDTIAFMDDNFIASVKKTKRLVNHILEKYPSPQFDWEIVGVRADMINSEVMDFFNRKNCSYAGFGVESMNTKSLIYMNKCLVKPEEYKRRVYKLLDTFEEYKIRCQLSSIIGLPEESKNEMVKQANFFIDLHNQYRWASSDVCPLVMHPKTPMYQQYLEGKLKVYRRPKGSPKRFYEGLFADKWEHLITFVPNAYRIANDNMPPSHFEEILDKIFKGTLSWLGPKGRNTYGMEREKVDRIEL